jgi:KaiC/GvpD/RAD55 family RecA-like ATPase
LTSTGIEELDRLLGGAGYPGKSAVMVVGPPGIGKESLGYWFLRSGLLQGDFCLYVTRLAVSEVKQDIRAFHANGTAEPLWIAADGGQTKLDVSDLVGLSTKVKEALRRGSAGGRVRVVVDILSSLLMLHPPETVYRFLTQLFSEIKQNYDAVILATVEDAMHPPQVLAAMQQLFDGVVEMRLYEKGLRVMPLMRIVKMRGLPPQTNFFQISFSGGLMELKEYG